MHVIRALQTMAASAALFAVIGSVSFSQTLPSGGSVVSGQVSTSKSNRTLTINQASENAIMNWQSFSIGGNNTVDVIQPNSSAALLDRVTGSAPSTIAGHLDANGQVFLINPNGIFITKSGVVDAGGGFVASTLNIADTDFNSGRLDFSGNGASAGVANHGTITIGRAGYAALLGGKVNNTGVIRVPLGKIGLGSGETATLDVSGDGFLQVAVPTRSSSAQGNGAALIQSSGTLSATGGSVFLSAATARAAARNAINLSGLVEANAISGHSGEIVLSGGDGGQVAVSGVLNATAEEATGGAVTITGQSIALSDASIDVSGAAGGGSVRVGGGLHGGGSLAAADILSVDDHSVIKADATQAGNGGSVVLWSNQNTDFKGRIVASGGASYGNGGDAEVSSHGTLEYGGSTVLTAQRGKFGDLLLDPDNVTISNNATSNGAISGSSFTPSGSNSVLNVSDLTSALSTANVTVSTGSSGSDAGNITVANALSWGTASTLTLSAYHSIAVNAGINISGAGGLVLTTNNGGSGGTLTFAQGAAVGYSGTPASGQTLQINGHNYTLLYTMTDLAGISGGTGYYALAQSQTPGSAYTNAVVSTFGGTFEGLGNTISNLTINGGSSNNIGLFGQNTGTIRDIGLVGGSVSGNSAVGGLVGSNNAGGYIANAFTTGTVTGTTSGNSVGGLVGSNGTQGGNVTIFNSFATGAVDGGYGLGGLVGQNGCDSCSSYTASITQAYATGAVGGTNVSNFGGLVGRNGGDGHIQYAYSTGAVPTAGGYPGGSIGYAYPVSNVYWDTSTSGINSGSSNGTSGITGMTTTQLQGTGSVTLNGFSGGAAGGTSGVYPYLTSFYPNGVQAISGIAYKDAAVTALASNLSGAAPVTVTINGVLEGVASTGVNGYYYAAVPAGTISGSGSNLVAYTLANPGTGALNGVTFATGTGTTGALNVYGGDQRYTTAATTYSSALAGLAPFLAYSTTPSWSTSLAPYITATGASFTLDQALNVSGSIGFQTTASNAPLTIAAPVTMSGSNTLTLLSGGTLAVNAPINVTGAAGVSLGYNTGSPNNLSFASGASLNYGATNNGGSLSINGQTYKLLYKLTDSVSATGNGTDSGTDDIAGIDGNSAAGADSGYYALATGVVGTGSASAAQFSHPLAGSGSHSFSGTFEGLGNTITNLTINDTSDANVGLFGANGAGTIRDLGMVGGSVTGSYAVCCTPTAVGGIAGTNGNGGTSVTTALIINDYNTGTVSAPGGNGGGTYVGGLVGYNNGGGTSNSGGSSGPIAAITNSFATGAVSGGSTTDAGGLAGFDGAANGGTVSISNAYATGAVTVAASASYAGGLVGFAFVNGGTNTIANVYSTGAVTKVSGSVLGGLIGFNDITPSNAYWDTTNSGVSSAVGSGSASGSTGFTTAALQNSATSGVVLGASFSGGAAGGTTGVYPYLTSFFPNGVQAISGVAYTNPGPAALASGTAGAGVVSVASGGAVLGTSDSGTNGYYYLAVPAGKLAANQGVAAFTQASTGAQDAVSFTQSSGGTTLANLNVYGGWRVDQPGTSLTTLSGLNSAYSTAIGATAPASFTLANREIDTTAAFGIDQSLSVTGTLVMEGGGNVTESGSATLSGAQLMLTGAGYSFILNDANQIGTLVASVGALSLHDAANLTTGTSQDVHGNPAVTGVGTSGALTLVSSGNITLDYPIFGGVSPTIAAGNEFVNDAGSSGVTATSGRWLIYSASPGVDTFGTLNSANTAIFNATYSSLPPGSVVQSGNRYLFSNQPALNVTSTSLTKTYGVDATSLLSGHYTISGFPSSAGAFIADTSSSVVSGAPSVTSLGSPAYAAVASGPYAINVSTGSLAASGGYAFNFVNSGQLAITPAPITVAGATGVNKPYDTTTALPSGASGFTSSGVLNADSVTVTASNAAYASANAGSESINVSGLTLSGSAAGNYSLSSSSVTGSGTIAPVVINLSGTRTYDAGVTASNTIFGSTLSGVGGETLTLTGGGTLSSKNVGTESLSSLGTLSLGNGSGSASNYTLVGGADSVNVTAATITVTGATGMNKTYDATTALPAGASAVASSGIFTGDSVTLTPANAAYSSANAGPETINVSGLTLSGAAAGNYVLSSTSAISSGTIAPAVINLSGTRTYDAGVIASNTIFGSTLSGVGGQTLTLAGSGTLAARNVGNEPLTSLGTLSLQNGSGLASNYTLVGGTDSVTVIAAPITVTGATGVNKTYDTTTALPSGTSGFASGGVLPVDVGSVTVTAANAAYASANAGQESINMSGLTISGPAAGNYSLTSSSASGSGTIAPAVINLSGTRTYDAGVTASSAIFGGSLSGVGGETLTLTGSGTLAGKNVGTESLASLGTLSLGNGSGLASNYTLVGGTDSVDVTPALIAVTGATGVNKTYDATTSLPSGAIGFKSSGVLPSDVGSVAVTAANAAYASANAGPESINVSGLSLSGAAADNYMLSSTSVRGSGMISAVAPPVPVLGLVAGGTGGFILTGKIVSASSSVSGFPVTVTGSLSNGTTTISGTFILETRGNITPSDEIAENATDVVKFVPGTLSAQINNPSAVDLASTAVRASLNEIPAPTATPYVYTSAVDTAQPPRLVETFSSPGFDLPIACVKSLCALGTGMIGTVAH